jgi:hypothetical protein
MDTILTVALFTISAVLAIIGFFLRTAYTNITNDIKDLKDDSHRHIEEQGKLKGKIELLEQESRLKLQHIEETTQHEIKNMASKVGELSDMVGELVRIQIRPRSNRNNS